jgi:hypothetical protein
MSENVGASTSRNPEDLHGLYGDNFTNAPIKHGEKNVAMKGGLENKKNIT